MSRPDAKLFRVPLVLASAALIMHIGTVSAADSKRDIQQQVREMLSGTPTAHFVPQSGSGGSKVTASAVDSQEFVKQLLLGTAAHYTGGQSEVSAPSDAQKHTGDMQAAVRQLLLGQPHARDAS